MPRARAAAVLLLLTSLVSLVVTGVAAQYPAPLAGANASRPLRVFDSNNATVDTILTVASLQGIVAQTSPAIYILPRTSQTAFRTTTTTTTTITTGSSLLHDTAGGQGTVRNSYAEWLREMQTTWGVDIAYTTSDLGRLVADFADEIAGFVTARSPTEPYTNQEQSLAAALMYCAQARCIVATNPTVEALLASSGLQLLVDFSRYNLDVFFIIFPEALPTSNPECVVFQNQTKFPCLADYVTFSRCPTFFGAINPIVATVNDSSTEIMARVGPSTVAVGWGVDELGTVAELSYQGSGIHAADWAFNLATLTSFRLSPGVITTEQITGTPTISTNQRHKVAFVMSDGDNVQWLLGGFQGPNWYGSPDRGRVPITWTLSEGLQYLAAPALHGLLGKATPKDTFMSGVSGASYNYPDLIPSALAREQARRAADARLAPGIAQNVIGGTFIVNEAMASLDDYYALNANATALYMPYYDYCMLNGTARRAGLNGGLFLTPRYCLWSPEFYNVTSLAATINAAAVMDPTSAAGYSVVLVHVWSHTVSDVVRAAQLLDSSRVDIVSLYDLIATMRANLQHG